MKKLTLILISVFLLTACAPNKEQEPTPNATLLPTFTETTGIYADWSKLSAPEQPANVGTRLAEGELTDLLPSGNYGSLMPYVGGELVSADFGSSWKKYKYGLVTMDGCVVLDPVLNSVDIISFEDEYAFVLGKNVTIGQETVEMRALCSADGSWCTDFLYSEIFTYNDGLIRLLDARYGSNGNYIGNIDICCMMDFSGNVVNSFSSIKSHANPDLPENWYLQYASSNFSDGYAVIMAEGKYAYIDSQGKALSSDELNSYNASAYTFNNGRAIVQPYETGLWGIIDVYGEWVIKPQYISLDGFNNGVAVATTTDGRNIVIDSDGNELADVSGLEYISANGLEKGIIIISWDENGDCICYDRNLNELGTLAYPIISDGKAVFITQGAIAVYDGENIIKIPGEYSMADMYNGFITSVTAQQEGQLMDMKGNVLISLPNCVYGVSSEKDAITGEPYLIRWDVSGKTVKAENGDTLTVSGYAGEHVLNGYINVTDETGSGIMNLKGEYILHIPVDFTD